MPAIRSATKTPRPYERYLRTGKWFARRNRALKDANYTCEACGADRNLNVHHRSYERLGAELPEDLEVLCRDCHAEHHDEETKRYVGLYARVISEVLEEANYPDVASLVEEAKQRCASLKIRYHLECFNEAVARVLPRFPGNPPVEVSREAANGPLQRGEAREVVRQLGITEAIKAMPNVKPPTLRLVEHKRALTLVMQAIVMQVERCEDVEKDL